MDNILRIEFQSFENFIDSPVLKFIHGTNIPLCLIISSLFYCGTIYYERYGGDPMKRSLKNKIISANARIWLLLIYDIAFGITWRLFIGSMKNEIFALGISFIRQYLIVISLLYFCEAMVYNVTSLFGWKYVCAMEEDFVSKYIFLFNIGFSFITQTSRLMLGSLKNVYYEMLSGTFSEDFGMRLFYPIFIPINLSIMLVGGNRHNNIESSKFCSSCYLALAKEEFL